jgi:citrate lyase subunit beta/citryl-CoA lyase
MRLRSLLFVPADSERKIARAFATEADALIFDLEDSVAPDRKAAARQGLAEVLRSLPANRRWTTFVRINPVGSGMALDDIRAVIGPHLDGVMSPKSEGAADLLHLSHALDMAEVFADLPSGQVRILPVVTETAKAVLRLPDLADLPALDRLVGLTWGGEDLATDIGALTNRRDDGVWDDTFRLARSLCLLAASAAEVAAIDTLHADFRDAAGLAEACRQARRSGFTGKLAIHPDQPAVINAAFTPSADEIAQARAVLAAFEATGGAGVASLEGRMLDRPHLLQAERLLALAP